MKMLFASGCILWCAMAAELARPGLLPHGSLLLPMVCGVIFWTRSTVGLLLTGFVLLLDWIARPSQLPLCPMVVPLLAVLCIAPSPRNDEYRNRTPLLRVPSPLQLPLLTVMALVLQSLGSLSWVQWKTLPAVAPALAETAQSLAMIALPLSAILSLMIRMADEFGMRRSFS